MYHALFFETTLKVLRATCFCCASVVGEGDEREGDEGEGNEMLVHAPHLCGDRVSGKVIAPLQRRLFAAFAQIDQQGDNDTQRQTA